MTGGCFHRCESVQVGGTPSPSHNNCTGPMSFLWGGGVFQVPSWGGGTPLQGGVYPSLRQAVPQSPAGGTPVPGEGTPGWQYPQARPVWSTPSGQVRMGYPSARTGWGTPWPGQDGVPPHRDRLGLDRLCRGRYVSCGFPQEDCFVICVFTRPLHIWG